MSKPFFCLPQWWQRGNMGILCWGHVRRQSRHPWVVLVVTVQGEQMCSWAAEGTECAGLGFAVALPGCSQLHFIAPAWEQMYLFSWGRMEQGECAPLVTHRVCCMGLGCRKKIWTIWVLWMEALSSHSDDLLGVQGLLILLFASCIARWGAYVRRLYCSLPSNWSHTAEKLAFFGGGDNDNDLILEQNQSFMKLPFLWYFAKWVTGRCRWVWAEHFSELPRLQNESFSSFHVKGHCLSRPYVFIVLIMSPWDWRARDKHAQSLFDSVVIFNLLCFWVLWDYGKDSMAIWVVLWCLRVWPPCLSHWYVFRLSQGEKNTLVMHNFYFKMNRKRVTNLILASWALLFCFNPTDLCVLPLSREYCRKKKKQAVLLKKTNKP